jgi:uncharacterized protein (TIGR03085 family)
MGLATEERSALAALFTEVGPDAPTLCAGWQTRDLAAHLVIRERRLDAAAGIAIPALRDHTQKVQDQYAAKPWDELVELVRTGPPTYSPYAIPPVNELVNGVEYFIHHEDVRRAQREWIARPPDRDRDVTLWRSVGMVGRMAYRRSPVGVALRNPDGETVVAKRGPATVTISGEPGELLLHAFGRDQYRLEFAGDERSVSAVQDLDRGM